MPINLDSNLWLHGTTHPQHRHTLLSCCRAFCQSLTVDHWRNSAPSFHAISMSENGSCASEFGQCGIQQSFSNAASAPLVILGMSWNCDQPRPLGRQVSRTAGMPFERIDMDTLEPPGRPTELASERDCKSVSASFPASGTRADIILYGSKIRKLW